MEVKLFEVRDRATFIPCFGIRMSPGYTAHGSFCPKETFLLRRAGFGLEEPLVLFGRLDGGECNHDPFAWGGRTLAVAHRYIAEEWSSLRSGDVVDVEFVLGEKSSPKLSERLTVS